jgi:putative DNA primase/helicase
MLDAGVILDESLIADGEIHRFRPEGDRNKNGWYFCHPEGYGAFGDWKTGQQGTWCQRRTLDPGEQRQLNQQIQEARRKRQRDMRGRQHQVAVEARAIWKAAHQIEVHPYLVTKGIRAHGLREYGGELLAPLVIGKKMWSLQRILTSGQKLFMKGGRVKGCHYFLGEPAGRIFLAEGFSTGATIREVTDTCVVIAFNAGNLPAVSGWLNTRFRDQELIIAADNDSAGIFHGMEAMQAGHASRMTYPPITGFDWNDFYQAHGAEKTKKELFND